MPRRCIGCGRFGVPHDQGSDYCDWCLTDARLFMLRVRLSRGYVTIYAFDANKTDSTGHSRIDVEVRHEGKIIFPRGATYCGTPRGTTLDGIDAKELVMSLVAMKPGDTDEDYFASYTPEQIVWAETFGEELSLEREIRYCDPETGGVKR